MSRYPGTEWRPLPEAGTPDGYDKTQFIVHSTGTVASAAANARYFARGDVAVESTFIVGLTAADPTVQVMDSTDKADANTTASRRAISVEVVGTGDMPFTDHQVAELVRLGRLAHELDGIPLRTCRAHDDPGYGWHVMFGAPGPWTTQKGKVCPGARRVAQLRTVVFPAIFQPTPAPAPEDEMTDDDRKIRNEQHTQVMQHLATDRRTALDTQDALAANTAAVTRLVEASERQTAALLEVRDLLRAR